MPTQRRSPASSPPKEDSQLEPPQPIPEVRIVDGPKPDPVANLEQPILEAYLEQQILDANLENPVPSVQQQNEDAEEMLFPKTRMTRTSLTRTMKRPTRMTPRPHLTINISGMREMLLLINLKISTVLPLP